MKDVTAQKKTSDVFSINCPHSHFWDNNSEEKSRQKKGKISHYKAWADKNEGNAE